MLNVAMPQWAATAGRCLRLNLRLRPFEMSQNLGLTKREKKHLEGIWKITTQYYCWCSQLCCYDVRLLIHLWQTVISVHITAVVGVAWMQPVQHTKCCMQLFLSSPLDPLMSAFAFSWPGLERHREECYVRPCVKACQRSHLVTVHMRPKRCGQVWWQNYCNRMERSCDLQCVIQSR